jgi:hypothetical protein
MPEIKMPPQILSDDPGCSGGRPYPPQIFARLNKIIEKVYTHGQAIGKIYTRGHAVLDDFPIFPLHPQNMRENDTGL